MKKLLLTVLALISTNAVGQGLTPEQNICNVPEPYIVRYYREIGLAQGDLQCGPPPRGTGVNMTFRGNGKGMVSWYYCKDDAGKYRPTFSAVTWDQLTNPLFVSELLVAYNAPDIVGGITAFAKKYFTVPLAKSPQLAVFCDFQQEMYRNVPGAPVLTPPTYTWWVKPNLTYNTRPYYRVDPITGKRSLTVAGQVNIATDCDPSKRKIVEVYATYMAFGPTFDPNLVTICTEK